MLREGAAGPCPAPLPVLSGPRQSHIRLWGVDWAEQYSACREAREALVAAARVCVDGEGG